MLWSDTMREVNIMMEESNFGKGLVYGGILSLGLWFILFDVISTLVG
ncbi:hypothetical protein [Bacillus cereus]|nr:hypothetical protein [Bacillus cereus]